MHSKAINLPRAFYTKYLKTIGGIKFTHREIDIIAFTLSGRSSKKIAAMLFISPRTVENHIRNIMIKLECNSREAIIDFAEKYGKFSLLKEYYLNSLTNRELERCLKSLMLLKKEAPFICKIVDWQDHDDPENSLAYSLDHHLKLAGLSTSMRTGKNNISVFNINQGGSNADYVIHIFPPEFPKEEQKEESQALSLALEKDCAETQNLLLVCDNPPTGQLAKEFTHVNFIALTQQKNYYSLVFEILKKIFPLASTLEKTIAEFTRKDEALNNFPASFASHAYEESTYRKPFLNFKIGSFLKDRQHRALLSCLIMSILVGILGLLTYEGYFASKRKEPLAILRQLSQPDLILPAEAAFLNRSGLLAQIENKLKDHPSSIQTIALVGIGGAGKTTLARQYARLQTMSIVWEINAETERTLIASFERLVYALSSTKEVEKEIKRLQSIKNPEEREEKIIHWVRAHLRESQNWLLIYDNVEKFSDIQKYFPSDPKAWGNGQVIITT